MKKILITLLALIAPISAHAGDCGPELQLYAEQQQDDEDGYRSSEEAKSEIGLKLKFVLGEHAYDDCGNKSEVDEERANYQRIQNLERIVKLCAVNDIPSLCSRIEELAAEID